MRPAPPTLWLVAGPNGVGKTTYALRHLRQVTGSVHFVNLDEIARGLSPLEPKAAERDAARVALSRIDAMIAARATFAVETTLSGRAHLRVIEAARRSGLAVQMLYFSCRSPEICLERIARRVTEGGHDVPEALVRRRFERSLGNLPAYLPRMDLWRVFETSGARPCVALEGSDARPHFADEVCLAGAHPAIVALPSRLAPA